MRSIRRATSLTLAALLAIACSRSADSGGDSAGAVRSTPAVASPQEKERPRACALVTAVEMSAILGRAVTAEPNDRSSGKTECVYKPASGISPYVEFSVDWGGGEAAMTAMGMMGQVEPGLANPYAGLGDQAAAIGPTLMIRTGEDLVNIVFSGVDDAPAAARRIFDTAKPRL